jgi:hypothetical protein
MPTLQKIDDLNWGDMILVNGKIFTFDSFGNFQQVYGPRRIEPGRHHNIEGTNLNDDGRPSSCVQLAFERLGVDTTLILEFKKRVGEDAAVPEEISRPILKAAGFEKIEFCGLVADFILQHPVGKFFLVSTDYSQNHAISMVDGRVFNLKFSSIKNQIEEVWKKV